MQRTESDHGGSAESQGFDLRRLKSEPSRLKREIESIDAQIRDSCLKNYRAYIENHMCFADIRENVCDLSSELSSAKKELPDLVRSAQEFITKGRDIADKHSQIQKTLHQHTQLLEILEVPQLMETCVRNGMFKEAIELLQFTNVLEHRHLSNPANIRQMFSTQFDAKEMTNALAQSRRIIAGIVDEVRRCAPSMRALLLRRLSGNVKLPMCLKLVGFLKRIDRMLLKQARVNDGRNDIENKVGDISDEVRNHRRLSSEFLQCREEWLYRSLRTQKVENAYQRIVTTVETSRIHWFDIITQHQAIFGSSTTVAREKTPSRRRRRDDDDDEATGGGAADRNSNVMILSRWIVRKTKEFLEMLSKNLDRIDDGAAIASVYEHCMYFGASLRQIGADFRPLLPSVFDRRLKALIVSRWNASAKRFESELSSIFDSKASIANLSVVSFASVDEELGPPSTFLVFPFVAALTNGYLHSFNELRQCALPSLEACLRESLGKSLDGLVDSVLEFKRRSVQQLYKKSFDDLFAAFCKIMALQFFPYILRCFDAIYPRIDGGESADIARIHKQMSAGGLVVSDGGVAKEEETENTTEVASSKRDAVADDGNA